MAVTYPDFYKIYSKAAEVVILAALTASEGLGNFEFSGIIYRMSKFLHIANANGSSTIPLWIAGVALVGIALLVLPAYLDAIGLQLLDNAFLSSLCGFAGWGPSAN